jgi:hypothetical protein
MPPPTFKPYRSFIGRQFYENKTDSDGWDDSGWHFGSGPNYCYAERVNRNSAKFNGDTWCRHADHNSGYTESADYNSRHTESNGAEGDSGCYDYTIDDPVKFDSLSDDRDSASFDCYAGREHGDSECGSRCQFA